MGFVTCCGAEPETPDRVRDPQSPDADSVVTESLMTLLLPCTV